MGAQHYDIDPTEFDTWVTPTDALASFKNKPLESCQRSIAERLSKGLLQAAARTTVFRNGETKDFYLILGRDWGSWVYGIDVDFWTMGDTTIPMADSTGYGTATRGHSYFGVKIDPVGLAQINGYGADAKAVPPTTVQTAPTATGLPSKWYWEPLLIEIARQLYAGELQPKSQADIQRAMHDWLTKQGETGGDTQVKNRARMLWAAIQ